MNDAVGKDLDMHTPTPDSISTSISLLPKRLIDLCELINYDYASTPLPRAIAVGVSHVSLDALGWRCVGDLTVVSPLTLLAFAWEIHALDAGLDALWPDALAVAQSHMGSILRSALTQPLAQAFSVRVYSDIKHEQRMSEAETDLPYSALIFEPESILEARVNGWPRVGVYDIWTPAGIRQVGTIDYSPLHAPLLSIAVREALIAAGCDLNLKLTRLPQLNTRTLNVCIKAGISTLQHLTLRTPEELFQCRNFGPTTFRDLVSTLRTYLMPRLALLPAELHLGSRAATSLQPVQTLSSRDKVAKEARKLPSNSFSALRESDLLAALDLYGVPWRDISVGTLIPQSASGPNASAAGGEQKVVDSLSPVDSAPPLEQANRLLAELMPVVIGHQHELALFGLTLGELLEIPSSRDRAPHFSVHQVDALTHELIHTLTARLLHHVLRPAALRQGYEGACATLQGVTIAELLTELCEIPTVGCKRLQPHLVDLLYERNGLRDGLPQTLESLGRQLSVTRERVRQLEKKAYEHLSDPHYVPMTRALGNLVRFMVNVRGGVATLADAAARLGACMPIGDLNAEAVTRFLARWCSDVIVTSDSLLIAQPYTETLVRQTQQALRSALLAQYDIARDDLIAEASYASNTTSIAVGKPFVAAVLETMGIVVAQGERHQPEGRGSIMSRIVHTMRHLGRPGHFSEIAAEYRQLFPEDAQRSDNSVHAFFSRFEDTFVLVGNGIFALAEWGYDPRIKNIAALVETLLEESHRPLHEEQIVKRALNQHHWQTQSIRAQLGTNPRIFPFGNGFFGLRDHKYRQFDPVASYTELFGEEPTNHDRLVVGTFTNVEGRQVVQVRLSPRTLNGQIPMTSKPIRDLFPVEGSFRALTWAPAVSDSELTLKRSNHDISGFHTLVTAARAVAGDFLFIERLEVTPTNGATAYRLALAQPEELAAAMRVVGLSEAGHSNSLTVSDITVLHYARKPARVARLIDYAIEHPWMSLEDLNTALRCLPANPASGEYLRLAQVTGMVSIGQPAQRSENTLRPTGLGRNWAFAQVDLATRGRNIALSLPAYRTHVRSLAAPEWQVGCTAVGTQVASPRILTAWDELCGISADQTSARVLEQHAALVSSDLLVGAALPLFLLLLVAQTQGQGLSRLAIDAALSGRTGAALKRLQALGLALTEDDLGRIALAEQVNIAVVSPPAVEQALAVAEGMASVALAKAWRCVFAGASAHHAMRASDLYSELQTLAPDLLYDALVMPPATTPECARYVDAELPFCGFPSLAADWALADPKLLGADTPRLETVVSYTCRVDRHTSQAPIGVALCDDLLTQPWKVERHLAGNAHLALLTVVAADEGNLAEHLRRSDADWRLDGLPLVSALDAMLRSLGYDAWDEHYRDDVGRKTSLGQELIALARRLNLLTADGVRLDAVSGIATRVYYDACSQGFTDRVSAAISKLSTLA